MGLAAIFNVPTDQQSTDEWAFSHAAHHRDINRVIFEKFGLVIPDYNLDPFNPEDTGTFGYQHQQMHNLQNAILGISGNDLVDVAWADPEERQGFIELNAKEHLQANAILGV